MECAVRHFYSNVIVPLTIGKIEYFEENHQALSLELVAGFFATFCKTCSSFSEVLVLRLFPPSCLENAKDLYSHNLLWRFVNVSVKESVLQGDEKIRGLFLLKNICDSVISNVTNKIVRAIFTQETYVTPLIKNFNY